MQRDEDLLDMYVEHEFRRRSIAVPVMAAVACALMLLTAPETFARQRHGTTTAVAVFPVPGSRLATPQTQITVRGLPVRQLGRISVTGSVSGAHAGKIEADSDGDGGSFLPNKPFTPGELVTVKTHLNVLGASNGTFRFSVESPLQLTATTVGPLDDGPGDLDIFHSQPGLEPPTVVVTKQSSKAAPGDIFLTPADGSVQTGAMIVNANGSLVWFNPAPAGGSDANFRVQKYQGHPVLTWWQGVNVQDGSSGEDVIMNSSYRRIALVRAGNGLTADLHEFELTPQGTALITADNPVWLNVSTRAGIRRDIVMDSVIQEIDIPTGLVLFQWDSLDHVPVGDVELPIDEQPGAGIDPFHANSIQQLSDGSLLVSARNTWAVYDLSHQTGRVLWTVGGKHSSFAMNAGTAFAFQHDARLRNGPGSDRTLTLFDDGGSPIVQAQSRGMTLRLNFAKHTATLVREELHNPLLQANSEGSDQTLPNGDQFIGWGNQMYFSEFNPAGRMIFEGRFVGYDYSYRTYRFPWTGTPRTSPSVAVSAGASSETAYVSWNGATQVSAWRVLGGSSPDALVGLATATKHYFETAITIPLEPWVAVEALSSSGSILGTSKVITAGTS